jgi:hypothetical protein
MDATRPDTFLSAYFAALGMQTRNIQAVASAQQKLLESFCLMAVQQTQFAQAKLRRLSDTSASPTATPPNLRATLCAQIDDLKTALMEGQAGTNALSEIMTRGGAEATSIMQKRFMTALDELKGFVDEAMLDFPAPSSIFVSALKVA